MARSTFGGGASDFVFALTPGRLLALAPATLTFWDASAGGSKHTDLLIGGNPVTEITVGADGQVPEFEGPDGIYLMWADTGTGADRVLLVSSGDLAAAAGANADRAEAAAASIDPTTLVREGDLVVSVKDHGAVGDGLADDGQAIDDALAAVVAAIPLTYRTPMMWFPEGVYLTNREHASNYAINFAGPGRLSSIIRIGPTFPSGGTLFSFTYAAGVSKPDLENHVPGMSMRGLTLDGNLRSTPAHALKLDRFNRLDLHIGVNAFDGSALVSTHSLGESRINGLRTWLCGNADSPVIDLDQAYDGTSVGANLNHFDQVDLLYSLGDQIRIRSGDGVVARYLNFSQCTSHGIAEWIDDYYDDLGQPITLTDEGNAPCRIVIDNARGISFDQCRIRRNGRGQPNLYLSSQAAGSSTVNSVAVKGSDLTFRGGAYASRSLATVDAVADTLTLAGVQTNRHHLQTGARVRFTGTALPPPLAEDTDYYAIRVDASTFKVATSRANALAGTAVDITGTGTGTLTQHDTAVTVDATANTLTAPDHRLTTGARFRLDGATMPSGTSRVIDYFVIRVDKDTVKLATSRADAVAGTAVDLLSTGTEVHLVPHDFLVDIESGTVTFDGNDIDTDPGGAVTRGYVRVESGGEFIPGVTNTWDTSVPPAEYATGAAPNEVAAAATDAATTQALVNQLRQLLVDRGLAQ